MPTGSVTGSTGVYNIDRNYVAGGVTRTTNPIDMMSGILMQKGFAILPQLDQNDVGFLWLQMLSSRLGAFWCRVRYGLDRFSYNRIWARRR